MGVTKVCLSMSYTANFIESKQRRDSIGSLKINLTKILDEEEQSYLSGNGDSNKLSCYSKNVIDSSTFRNSTRSKQIQERKSRIPLKRSNSLPRHKPPSVPETEDSWVTSPKNYKQLPSPCITNRERLEIYKNVKDDRLETELKDLKEKLAEKTNNVFELKQESKKISDKNTKLHRTVVQGNRKIASLQEQLTSSQFEFHNLECTHKKQQKSTSRILKTKDYIIATQFLFIAVLFLTIYTLSQQVCENPPTWSNCFSVL